MTKTAITKAAAISITALTLLGALVPTMASANPQLSLSSTVKSDGTSSVTLTLTYAF